MFGLHEMLHNEYGICLWLILTIAMIAAMVIVLGVHLIRQKRRDDIAGNERRDMAETAASANPERR